MFVPFALFLSAIMLSVLRFMDSDYPFGILKLFLPFRSTIVFSGVVVRSFVFYVLFYRSLIVLFLLVIVLFSFLLYKASDFGVR
jgi:hypothetical protein